MYEKRFDNFALFSCALSLSIVLILRERGFFYGVIMKSEFEKIVNLRDYHNMVGGFANKLPEIGEYLITGIQAGNFNGELGWHKYIGYVVQIRKKAGAFGSDMILLRDPHGDLARHENQSFHRPDMHLLKRVKACFKDGIVPEMEDYTHPYTLGDGEYQETGKIIEPSGNMPKPDNSPLMQITTTREDGSKVIEVV